MSAAPMSPYTFGARVEMPIEQARQAIEQALRAEGFGVLTEIDVAATMKAKLGVELAPQVILGACNPPLAHRAINAEPSVSALLPCNVVLRQEGAQTVVEIIDPQAAFGLVGSPQLEPVAREARERLLRAVTSLESN